MSTLRVDPVLTEGRAPIGRGGTQKGSSATNAWAEEPLADVGGSSEPHCIGRHRLDRIVLKERDNRGHVLALKGVDIPGEQFLLLSIHRLQGFRLLCADGGECPPRPLERAVNRRPSGGE